MSNNFTTTHGAVIMFSLKNLRKPSIRRAIRRAEAGQSLVEFAIAVPFMLILLIVMVEVGFLLRTHTGITAVVREGTKAASTAGNQDPYDASWDPTLQDADFILISQVNIGAQSDLSRISFVATYRADSTAGRTSYSGSASGTGDGSAKIWPVVTTVAQGGLASGAPYQRVFAKVNGKYTTQVLTGVNCTNALSSIGWPTAGTNPCGKNWDPTSATTNNKPPRKSEITTTKINEDPWYPTFRRCRDITQGITSDITQANKNSNYYNNPTQSAHWIGVRIDYTYDWYTKILPFPTATLSDRAVKILEPNPSIC